MRNTDKSITIAGMRIGNCVLGAVVVTLLTACGGGIPQQQELVVLTRSSPTTYQLDRHGQAAGPVVDLLSDFAAAKGWTVRFKPVGDIDQLFEALELGKGHLAAAGLSGLPNRFNSLRVSEPFQNVGEVLVCRRGGPNPNRLDELANAEIAVADDTVFVQRMIELEYKFPSLNWKALPFDVEALLERVLEGRGRVHAVRFQCGSKSIADIIQN